MSHSSGIDVSDALSSAFTDARNNADVRLLKVQIEDEQINLTGSEPLSGDWEADFALVPNHLDADDCCYILYRTDTEGANGFEWLVFSYVPDTAPVRHKMLYASTKDNLKKQLGDSSFRDEIFGTEAADFSLEGYQHHKRSQNAPAPLTDTERQTRREHTLEYHSGPTRAGVHGIAFPLTEEAAARVGEYLAGSISYVQLGLDMDAEVITLEAAESISVMQLAMQMPTDGPRYHLFRYEHTHEGSQLSPTLFIYSNPAGSKIKLRMLFSSAKQPCEEQLAGLGVEIEKKLEVDEASELTPEEIERVFHPPAPVAKKTFAKPKMAGGRRRPRRKAKK